MSSQVVKLPPYVVARLRNGQHVYYFQLPKRLRPAGWPAALRLPIELGRRTGHGDAAELAAVTADGGELYRKLRQQRSGKDEGHRPNSLPWLIQLFDKAQATRPRKGRKRAPAKGSIRNHKYAARVVLAWSAEAGHPDVKMITRQACLSLLDGMNDKPSKRRLLRSYLRMLMKHAMDVGCRTDNPVSEITSEVPDAEVHIWTDEELAKMVDAAEKIDLGEIATAMLIAHDEGPRPVDILNFQRFRDYAPKDRCFRYFQQKTNEWVVSPAGHRVADRLAKQSAERLMLVVNKNTGKQYNQRVFNRDFDRVRTEAKLSYLQFRHLRHTFVVKAKRAGLDEFEIAAKTGHSPKSVRDMLARHYLPHDSVVASNATVRLEAYRRSNRERKFDMKV